MSTPDLSVFIFKNYVGDFCLARPSFGERAHQKPFYGFGELLLSFYFVVLCKNWHLS